jgi:hypothetical protein
VAASLQLRAADGRDKRLPVTRSGSSVAQTKKPQGSSNGGSAHASAAAGAAADGEDPDAAYLRACRTRPDQPVTLAQLHAQYPPCCEASGLLGLVAQQLREAIRRNLLLRGQGSPDTVPAGAGAALSSDRRALPQPCLTSLSLALTVVPFRRTGNALPSVVAAHHRSSAVPGARCS